MTTCTASCVTGFNADQDRPDFDGRPIDVVFDVPLKTAPTTATVETPMTPALDWPALMSEAVRLGVFGDILQAIAPHTEADPAALLLSALAAFGVALGRTAYWEVEADRHYLLLFVLLAGISSKGRKGVSEGHIPAPLRGGRSHLARSGARGPQQRRRRHLPRARSRGGREAAQIERRDRRVPTTLS